MNKKVFATCISLVVIFLAAMYVLKIFYPEQFVLAIENEQLIKIGMFIDTHSWARYAFGICTSFITYWFYCCACCQRWHLKWYECLIVLVTIGINIGLSFWNMAIYQHFNICSMLLLPLIFKAKLRPVAIVYTIHGFAQILSLQIRNLPMFMTSVNALTRYIVGIECWLWLVFFYLYYNYNKKKEV